MSLSDNSFCNESGNIETDMFNKYKGFAIILFGLKVFYIMSLKGLSTLYVVIIQIRSCLLYVQALCKCEVTYPICCNYANAELFTLYAVIMQMWSCLLYMLTGYGMVYSKGVKINSRES